MPPANRTGGRAPTASHLGSSRDMEQSEDAPSSSASPAPAPKAKRKRITPEQQEVLNKVFETTDTPNLEMREQLSAQIGMTPREIQVYYQNQRAKRRRLARSEAAQAALSAATAAATPPAYASPPFGMHTAPSGMVAALPSPAPVLPPPVPSPSAYYPRRRSLDDLLSPAPASEPSRDDGRIRLPPLREVFPDLLPPIPGAYQLPRPGSASSSAAGRVPIPPPDAVSAPATRASSSASSQPIMPEEAHQASAASTPPTTVE